LHSLLTDLTVFDGVRGPLAESRRVTRINLPGFGRSTPVVLESVADHADHVAAVMTALELGPDTAVFANGFGAFVAAELAIRHGARFDRLILADVVAAFPEAARTPFRVMAGKVRADGMAAVLDTAIGRMFPPAFAAANAMTVAARKQALAGVDQGCFARACLALAALDLTPRLRGIRNKTLVACGALDQTTPPALARELAAGIPGAVYREIPGAGHCPMLEQPAALVALLREFLD
jgi:3-oxoadipate enol-lactonase